MRCPQPQSCHRRGCEVLRCYSTPHSSPQANSKRPHSINRCEERLFVGNSQWCFNSVRASIGFYTIDLVEAPLSVCVLPHLRLPKVVETTGAGDDPRRIRERTVS